MPLDVIKPKHEPPRPGGQAAAQAPTGSLVNSEAAAGQVTRAHIPGQVFTAKVAPQQSTAQPGAGAEGEGLGPCRAQEAPQPPPRLRAHRRASPGGCTQTCPLAPRLTDQSPPFTGHPA